MVSDNKILTVSYGTFSCTLEGFDDPFSTMRSIAEYFRDLAADDRYFGAEPPTPDADMLHRIAEKEIQRRVEARVEENGVVLRQSADAPATGPAPYATTAYPATSALSITSAAMHTAKSAPPTQAAPTQAAPKQAAQPRQSPLNAPLTPDSAPVAQETPQDRSAPAQEDAVDRLARQAEEEADHQAQMRAKRRAKRLAQAEAEQDAQEHAQKQAKAMAEEAMRKARDEAAAKARAKAPAAPAAPSAAAPSASIAEKLSRIRAVVSGEDYTEDQHAEDDKLADIAPATATAQGHNTLDAADTADETVEDLDINAVMKAARLVDPAPQTPQADDASEDLAQADPAEGIDTSGDDATEADADSDTALDAVTSAMSAAPSAQDAPATVEKATDENETTDDPTEDTTEEDADTALSAQPEPVEPTRRARARVIKMRRADVDTPRVSDDDAAAQINAVAALAQASDESGAPETAASADGAKDESLAARLSEELGASSLDDDAEADLLRELAAVATDEEPVAQKGRTQTAKDLDAEDLAAEDLDEADEQTSSAALQAAIAQATGTATEAPAPDADGSRAKAETAKAENEGRAVLEQVTRGDETVDRLLQTTDRELDLEDGKRRRNAIQHLKAAVAATRAKQEDGEKETNPDEAEVYREDLARVVRPARPAARRTERPQGMPERRLAPLMLVSEQRIDTTETKAPQAPVRPRRVGTQAPQPVEAQDTGDNIFTETTSFADYADDLGASSLTDMLEAAVAYSALVEGRPHVSRPQVLKQVSEVIDGGFTREEGLKSFGTLLRQNRIQKQAPGQFILAHGSRFGSELAGE
ncbi:hypothetical protein AQS8620_01029 [Aquimixticola soesokkakensis]|uniref:Lipoprotein n=1 Tax=Aquimixticola soesokkakensis TaxID=1519096 RepID=A0A1Y5S7G4_9RHOB|nr:hypothetical protein [Aquimixticola soesokkakensis]SLN31565.1 hypothetical protein AQS8620_01029 [Aquimixticola soesokkakensis]